MTPVRRAALLALLGSSFAAVPALAQTFTAPGSDSAPIDTSRYNVMTFEVAGGGGAAGGHDSGNGGSGAAGARVSGSVQVGPPYTTVNVFVGSGGQGGLNSRSTAETGAPATGGPGQGAGGAGGKDGQSGGGGGGGGASSLNIDSIWVRSGGGGGGGGGTTVGQQRPGYPAGVGMNANSRYDGVPPMSPVTATNPPVITLPLETTPTATADCQTAAAGAAGLANNIPPDNNGSGGGGNGGTYANAGANAAYFGRDGYWVAEGGATGKSCTYGAVEPGATVAATGGTAGNFARGLMNQRQATAGNGSVSVVFSFDGNRVPTIGSISNTGEITINDPATMPPGQSVTNYTVTCTGGGQTLTGGPSASPVNVPGMVAGTAYSCTAVAQLQDDATGTPTISTLPSPPASITPPITPATPPGITATPGDTTATVTLTPPTTLPLGATVVSYDVTCTGPGGYSQTQTGITPATPTTATFTGMTNGQTYSCTTTANLSGTFGTAGPSAPAAVVPNGPIPPVAVPTLNEWMLLLTSAAVAGMALRRRRSRG